MTLYELTDLYATYAVMAWARIEFVFGLSTAVVIATFTAGSRLSGKLLGLGLALYSGFMVLQLMTLSTIAPRLFSIIESIEKIGAEQAEPLPVTTFMMTNASLKTMQPLIYTVIFTVWAGVMAFSIMQHRSHSEPASVT